LELGEDGEHPEHRAALGGAGVVALLDDLQPDAAVAELSAEDDEVEQAAPEPVQPGDH